LILCDSHACFALPVSISVDTTTILQRAIKRIKGRITWDKIASMRELQCIIRVPLHPNIVRLFEVHRTASSTLCYVFEYMPHGSLHDLLHDRSVQRLPPLPTADIQSLVRQILSGLAHLHRYHHMHRDMKPENILLCRGPASGTSSNSTLIAKVADFSLARCCATEAHDPITSYVSTRWYRAPEVLLQAGAYGCPVDNFAVGSIAAEMCRQKALFAGRHELDQLHKIFSVLGSPSSPHQSWNDGVTCMHKLGLQQPPPSNQQHTTGPRHKLEQFLFAGPTADHVATRHGQNLVDFVWGLLALNPERRLTAEGALRHPYLQQQEQQQSTMMTTATWTPAEDKISSSGKLVTVSPAAVPVHNVTAHSLQRRDIFSP
jgi:serine/threonine protein kinase